MEKLERLNCEGCTNLSDNAFKFILISSTVNMFESACQKKSSSSSSSHQCKSSKASRNNHQRRIDQDRCAECANSKRPIEELHRLSAFVQTQPSNDDYEMDETATLDIYHGQYDNVEQTNVGEFHHDLQNGHVNDVSLANRLRSINLSGCWSITDSGLR